MQPSGLLSNISVANQSGFKTLGFVDIETTGLGTNAQIWQVCVVAVKVESFFGSVQYEEYASFNKLYNPVAEIHPEVVLLTGMTNERLQDKDSIDNNARGEFKEFLHGLQSPVCLFAHNGFNFDFPFLKRDFGESFPSSIKFVDTIDLFKVHQSMFSLPGGISFKLKDVFRRFFGQEPTTQHEAKSDVQTLIRCLLHVSKCPRMIYENEHLSKYIIKYCKRFDSIGAVSRDYRKSF